MDGLAVVGALVVALLVQSAAFLLLFLLHLRAERAWSAERTHLINLAMADTPRDFAVLQKASATKPDERPEAKPAPQPMVGIGI